MKQTINSKNNTQTKWILTASLIAVLSVNYTWKNQMHSADFAATAAPTAAEQAKPAAANPAPVHTGTLVFGEKIYSTKYFVDNDKRKTKVEVQANGECTTICGNYDMEGVVDSNNAQSLNEITIALLKQIKDAEAKKEAAAKALAEKADPCKKQSGDSKIKCYKDELIKLSEKDDGSESKENILKFYNDNLHAELKARLEKGKNLEKSDDYVEDLEKYLEAVELANDINEGLKDKNGKSVRTKVSNTLKNVFTSKMRYIRDNDVDEYGNISHDGAYALNVLTKTFRHTDSTVIGSLRDALRDGTIKQNRFSDLQNQYLRQIRMPLAHDLNMMAINPRYDIPNDFSDGLTASGLFNNRNQATRTSQFDWRSIMNNPGSTFTSSNTNHNYLGIRPLLSEPLPNTSTNYLSSPILNNPFRSSQTSPSGWSARGRY